MAVAIWAGRTPSLVQRLVNARLISCRLSRLPQRVFYGLWMTCDHSQKHPRRSIRPRPTLFPVLQRSGLETELRGKP
jgi:hypothetical protein